MRNLLRVVRAWAWLAALFSTTLLHCQNESYAISGTLVTARGVVNDGIVLISHGAIEGIGSKIPVPKGIPIIDTGGVIFPGLIDLHNHLVWNVFPRWALLHQFAIGTTGKRCRTILQNSVARKEH